MVDDFMFSFEHLDDDFELEDMEPIHFPRGIIDREHKREMMMLFEILDGVYV